MKGKEEKPIQECQVGLSHHCGQLQVSPAKDSLRYHVKCLKIIQPEKVVTIWLLLYWSRVILWNIDYLPSCFVRVLVVTCGSSGGAG